MKKQRQWQVSATCLAVMLAGIAQIPSALEASTPEAAPAAPAYRVVAPARAPNVVIVLLDDVGFGATSTFGGPVETPALDALAKQGVRYNRFHTTAICSPTRASLLTGRNPHATGIGAVMNSSDARPGYSGFHPKDTASIAQILRQNGYNTAAFGKWHQTPDWEVSPNGPMDRWPTGEGFERFYGFQGGETDQFDPTLFEGTTPVMRPAAKGYHLTEDLADQAIVWLNQQHALMPDKPAFLYFAPGATHAPLQAPREWIEKFHGRFDQGWDRMRTESFARQKKLGIIPADARLTPRDPRMPAWDALTPDERKVAAHQMEVYAGFLAHTDAQIAKLIDALKANGEFENTLFFYIVGDNGASGEGGLLGSSNYMGALQGLPENDAMRLAVNDQLGSAGTYPHYAAGWAWAMNTPFQWMKTVASHLGGTRNGMVVSWPREITQTGGVRAQFGHVNDIAPTILEAAGIPMPQSVDGVAQKPMDGTSLLYSFNTASAPERHRTQYFEVFGHRAIYHDGWMASAFHARLPWMGITPGDKSFDDDRWELYDLTRDFSQSRDLAAKEPKRLAELKQLFLSEASRNQLLPLRNVTLPDRRGMPSIANGRTRMAFSTGAHGIPETALPPMVNRSFTVDATVDAGAHPQGVIAALGGTSAGWSLWIDAQGHLMLSYQLFQLGRTTLRAANALAPGRHTLRFDFVYDGGGYARGAELRILVDGAVAGSARIAASPPAFFTIDETFDVGLDRGSPVGAYPDAAPGYALTDGVVREVVIESK